MATFTLSTILCVTAKTNLLCLCTCVIGFVYGVCIRVVSLFLCHLTSGFAVYKSHDQLFRCQLATEALTYSGFVYSFVYIIISR